VTPERLAEIRRRASKPGGFDGLTSVTRDRAALLAEVDRLTEILRDRLHTTSGECLQFSMKPGDGEYCTLPQKHSGPHSWQTNQPKEDDDASR
jgi:hypothetical protein